MQIPHDDEQFESHLKQFRPVAPASLPMEAHRRSSRRPMPFLSWGMMAAAAAIGAVLLSLPQPRPDGLKTLAAVGQTAIPPLLTIETANALLANAASFQSAVDLLGIQVPNPQPKIGTQSALAVLSKEKL